MTEQRWRRPGRGAHREQVAATDTDADTALLPAYREDAAARPDHGDLTVASEPGDLTASSDHGALTAPSEHGDLAAELAAAAPRRWWNRATIYLGAAALLVGGFVAGAQVQQKYGEPSTPAGAARPSGNGNNAGGMFGGYPGAQTGGGQGQTGGQAQSGAGSTAAAAPTTGKVKLVDGTTVYVETSSGDVVTVRTNGQTKVQAATSSSLKNLAAGDSVTVQGQSASDGTVTATTVTETK
jgi:hypothetical protein